ncbi:putative periplasmic serine endoprotease DegP-like precursor [Phycisphaerae bacterium RAS2]|nr:putative periplasmic serine endoprotease DegP-like precursor [Phycisphaerae bacterium RAS2]
MRALQTLLLIGLSSLVATTRAHAENRPSATQSDFRQIVQSAKDKVFPAVVFIKCIRESMERGKKISQEVSGSGVIISAEGDVLTNWHVIDKAVEVRCLLFDGRAMNATILGSDKDTDLGLLKLTPEEDAKLPFASLGDSEVLREGDFVMAMGAPWGLNRSVSIGIIACSRRFIPSHSEYSHWLQTDASISPGNSGGPLVNTDGQVIGINALANMSGGDMGFAIPSVTIAQLVPQLRSSGCVNWSWTGLQLQPLRDFNRNIYFDASDGVIVAETDPESPARRAGIEGRDRIIRVNGEPITAATEEDLPEVRRRLGMLPKGEVARFDIARGGESITLEVTPRVKGKVEGEELDCPRWDLTVKAINQFDNPELFFYRKVGVFVFGVKYPGNASNAGLNEQDILLKVGETKVETLDDVRAAHKASLEIEKGSMRTVITVLRQGLLRQVVLDYSRDFEKE